MVFHHLLLIFLNLRHTEAHVQHGKYIIYCNGTMFLAIKKLMSKYAVHEERPAKNHKTF